MTDDWNIEQYRKKNYCLTTYGDEESPYYFPADKVEILRQKLIENIDKCEFSDEDGPHHHRNDVKYIIMKLFGVKK